MKTILNFLFFTLFSIYCYSQSNVVEKSCQYLKEYGQNPSEYVVSKFKEYDYVFLGEYHRNKQDVDFVAGLIPKLYENGIRNIAYEFYEYANQSIIDSLLTAKEWDKKTLYHLLSKGNGVTWGYKEYLNIFRKAWEFNQTLKEDQPKFRIVLLAYEYFPCKEGIEKFGGVDPDAFHAQVLYKELISKNEKALVHCGMHHAFTSYHQPIYDFEKNELLGFSYSRLGNIIEKECPGKTFTIFLHAPWASNQGWDKPYVKPVNGIVDSAMAILKYTPVGFDVKNTFMGSLKATNTYYAFGYDNFKLEDYCDGYIFLLPYNKVKFVSVDPDFYDEYNLEKLRTHLKCIDVDDEIISAEDAVEILTEKPEIHYRGLIE